MFNSLKQKVNDIRRSLCKLQYFNAEVFKPISIIARRLFPIGKLCLIYLILLWFYVFVDAFIVFLFLLDRNPSQLNIVGISAQRWEMINSAYKRRVESDDERILRAWNCCYNYERPRTPCSEFFSRYIVRTHCIYILYIE